MLHLLVLAISLTGLVATGSPAQAADTGNAAPQPGRIVSDEPGSLAPNILDGTVNSVAKVGNTIVVGGTFSQAQNYNTSATVTRNRVLSFNAATGQLNTGFAPNPDNTVFKVLPAADGQSVYVAGRFNNAAGRATPGRIIKLNATTGAVDPNFTAPSITGDIRDLELVGNHLFIAGKFTHINGVAQRALGTVYADTGRRDPYFNAVLAGTHNTRPGALTNVLQISIDQQNQHLMAVGNFTTVDGQNRHQIAKFDVANLPTNVNTAVHQSLSPWSTNLFTSACSGSFETYMTDVEYSPDGTFFVVSTTGAYGGSSGSMAGTSGCDVVARFEDDVATGPTPATWTAYTGGDSTWTVEVTDNVVYAGGHQRWQNNPGSRRHPRPGRRQPCGHRRAEHGERDALLLEPHPLTRRRRAGHARHERRPLRRVRHHTDRPHAREHLPRADRVPAARRRRDAAAAPDDQPARRRLSRRGRWLPAGQAQLQRHHWRDCCERTERTRVEYAARGVHGQRRALQGQPRRLVVADDLQRDDVRRSHPRQRR